MKSRIWQPVTLPTPLKPPKNQVFFHNSSIACRRMPPPIDWIRSDGVERFREYLKTLTSSGIRNFNTMVDNIVEDSLREQVLEIPLVTITKDDLEIVIEGEIHINVMDPLLASSLGDNKHLISAVTCCFKKHFLIGSTKRQYLLLVT
ncbi:hypothetical protein SLEP1_g27268 [Rubroshorea leprosula]|uniref:Uncharacterized protein n=1 Tax=Rubroshorea leprosula TaxID=152421 RepID=A0AAV5JQ02_9ROSI|nr:hypothetical protein SLEP1_g27268 [Rubroshorea leprosula]